MSKPRLIYFDAPVSRGEECRLAFHLAAIDFEDVRIKRDAWPSMKPTTPYGSLPVLEMPGQPPLAQTNAILVLLGKLHGLHPTDPYEAARHEAMMCHVEDLRGAVGPTIRITDEAEKKKVREGLVAGFLPAWGGFAEKHISSDGPFFAGAKLHVADLKLFIAVRWLASGAVDHIPATIFTSFPKLTRLFEAVGNDARVKSWTSRF
jgi:glutathione S-transferase